MFKNIIYGSVYGSLAYVVISDLNKLRRITLNRHHYEELDTPLIFNNGFVIGAFFGLCYNMLPNVKLLEN